MFRNRPSTPLKMPLTERETIITFNEKEPHAHVSTMNPAIARNLKRYAEEFSEIMLLSEDEYGASFTLPKSLITIRKPYVMSEQARKEASERMSLLNKKSVAKTLEVEG